jgi:hypothetical protein
MPQNVTNIHNTQRYLMQKSSFKKIPYIFITIFWAVTMTMMIVKHYFPGSLRIVPYKTAVSNELYEEQWMGAYLNGEKIGYSCRKITELNNGYRVSEALKVRLRVMGAEKDMETVIDAETDQIFRLLSFVFKLKSDITMEIKGKVDGKNLLVSMDTGGLKSKKTILLKEPPYLNLSIMPNILRKGLKSGDKISIPIIDPATLSQEYMEMEVIGMDSIVSLGRTQDAYKVRGIFKGIETHLWLTEKGEVLREESPIGFTLIKETKENAIKLGRPSIDLIAQVAIPFNLNLSPDTEYLKVRLLGVDLKKLEVDGGRQTLRGDILEIKKELLGSGGENNPPSPPLNKEGKRGLSNEYLKDTMFIQLKDPAIVSLAKDIVSGEKDMLKMSKLIYEWVYKNIKKVPIISLPLSTEVLRTRQGDCNEHTTLFTALARAAGIPTRIAVGLTYKDGFFYYHAWPEIYLNGWVAVDPTLGQFPADASHIRLLTGDIDRQLQLITIIGKLKLEGIEYH